MQHYHARLRSTKPGRADGWGPAGTRKAVARPVASATKRACSMFKNTIWPRVSERVGVIMKLLVHGVPTQATYGPRLWTRWISHDAYLAQTLPGFDARTHIGFLGLNLVCRYLRPSRAAGLIRMKVSAERDIGRCRLALDRVADPFGSRIATTAGIWTPSWVTIRCRRGPEEKACSLDPERRCRLKEAEEIRQHDYQKGGVPNWKLEACLPARQFSARLPPPGGY